MRSPLEYEPDLIAGVGLVTVRWAALEHQLASLFSRMLKIDPAGDGSYYALSNFSQRLDLVEKTLTGSLRDPRAANITRALFVRIRRLWTTRNGLIHSHYAYVGTDWQGNHVASVTGIDAGTDLGHHPREDVLEEVTVLGPDGSELPQPKVTHHGFAYEKRSMPGQSKWIFVNRGTFENHANQVMKRSRQISKLDLAIRSGIAPLRTGSFFVSSPRTRSPRAPQNRGQAAVSQDS